MRHLVPGRIIYFTPPPSAQDFFLKAAITHSLSGVLNVVSPIGPCRCDPSEPRRPLRDHEGPPQAGNCEESFDVVLDHRVPTAPAKCMCQEIFPWTKTIKEVLPGGSKFPHHALWSLGGCEISDDSPENTIGQVCSDCHDAAMKR